MIGLFATFMIGISGIVFTASRFFYP